MTTATAKKPKKAAKPAKEKAAAKPKAKMGELIVSHFDYSAIREADADRLRKYAENVADAGGRYIKSMYDAGTAMKNARDLCEKRQSENAESGKNYSFRAWLADTGIHPGTAYRYIAAVEKCSAPVLKYATGDAIYLLCAGTTPAKAVEACEKLAEKSQPINAAIVKELIKKYRPEPTPAPDRRPTIGDILALPPPAAGEDGSAPPAGPVVDAISPNSCPSGGDHIWVDVDEHGHHCSRCHVPYSKREFGAKVPREDRKEIIKTMDKLGRQLKDAGVLDRCRAELSALNAKITAL